MSNATSLAVVDEAFNEEGNDCSGDVQLPSRDANQSVQPVLADGDGLAVPQPLWDNKSDDYSNLSAAIKTVLIELISE